MCYHSNKLNVHYLHYIRSRGVYESPPLEEERQKSHHHTVIISKLHFAGSSTQRNLFTLKQQHYPGWSVERQCPGQGGAGTHAKEREGVIDTSKQKCHKSRNDGI